MILPLILKSKLLTGGFVLGGILLAVAETSTNRDLIIVSLIGSGTTLLVTMLSAGVSIYNARHIEKLRNSVDGMQTELIKAKEGVAQAKGVAMERERGEEKK